MNKTVTINLSGIVFHIDEYAYEILKKYLVAIKQHFANAEGREEIIADIEARFAEIFQSKLNEGKQVILENDVQEAITVMGQPEDFNDEQEPVSNDAKTKYGYNFEPSDERKRLFRDPDDKIIGGVCSGISHYLGFDPIWLRLAFVLTFFIFGWGFLCYIILLIIMPKAKTTADKLQMRGHKVNVENIEKAIKEEIEGVKNRFNDWKNEAKGMGKSTAAEKVRNFISELLSLCGAIILGAVRFFIKFIIVLVVIVGLGLLFMLMAVLTGHKVDIDNVQALFTLNSLIDSDFNLWVLKVGLGLFIGIPLVKILYAAIKYLFNIDYKNKIANYAFLALWLVGLVFTGIIVFHLINDFSDKQAISQNVKLIQPTANTMYVNVVDTMDNNDYSIHIGNWRNVHLNYDIEKINLNAVELNVVKSQTGDFELTKIQSSRGKDMRTATENAEHIQYSFTQTDSVLSFNAGFTLDKNEKFRNQKVKMILKVPVGKSVFFGDQCEKIIYDIKNYTDTYDDDMVGHHWLMTEAGLKCTDCSEINRHRYKYKYSSSEEEDSDEEAKY